MPALATVDVDIGRSCPRLSFLNRVYMPLASGISVAAWMGTKQADDSAACYSRLVLETTSARWVIVTVWYDANYRADRKGGMMPTESHQNVPSQAQPRGLTGGQQELSRPQPVD